LSSFFSSLITISPIFSEAVSRSPMARSFSSMRPMAASTASAPTGRLRRESQRLATSFSRSKSTREPSFLITCGKRNSARS